MEEVNGVFKTCGVIAEEIDSGLPRIKLYTDEAGNLKGDALVVYFRPESVQLAIQMLDDTDFRLGEPGPMGKMRVKEADFSYKKQKEAPAVQNVREKNKVIRKMQKMNKYVNLISWSNIAADIELVN
jgi:HIV Tat-specific factor 1